MFMFNSRNSWLANELTNITKVLTKLSNDFSALNQQVNSIHSDQGKHDTRLESHDQRITILERNDTKEASKWDGLKILYAVGGAFLVILTCVSLFLQLSS